MNPTIKLAIGILGGAAVSGGITWFVTKKTLDKKYNDVITEIRDRYIKKERDLIATINRAAALDYAAEKYLTLDAQRDFYDIVNDILQNGIPDEDENEEEVDDPDGEYVITSDREIESGNQFTKDIKAVSEGFERVNQDVSYNPMNPVYAISYEEARALLDRDLRTVRRTDRDLQQILTEHQFESAPGEYNPDDPTEEELYPERFEYPEPTRDIAPFVINPYVISQDECGDGENDIECLVYYDGDGILATETEEVLNIDEVIGEEALSHFEDGLVYVRNNRLGLDYEVRWEGGSYAHNVMGIDYENYPTVEKIKKGRQRDEFDG